MPSLAKQACGENLIWIRVFGQKDAQRANSRSRIAGAGRRFRFWTRDSQCQNDRLHQFRLLDGLAQMGGDVEFLTEITVAGTIARRQYDDGQIAHPFITTDLFN